MVQSSKEFVQCQALTPNWPHLPVRLLSSSVLKWPDFHTVDQAIRSWVKKVIEMDQGHHILQVGYFGSYARGDWGVGSDLDLIIIIDTSMKPYISRASEWDVSGLPVPVDLLVYTKDEWGRLYSQSRFYQTIINEIVWVY